MQDFEIAWGAIHLMQARLDSLAWQVTVLAEKVKQLEGENDSRKAE